MAHFRKEIRRVLDEMGFDNRFFICDESLLSFYSGGPLSVTIKDWEPHPDAMLLKRRLQCCADNGVEVHFQLGGPGGGLAG